MSPIPSRTPSRNMMSDRSLTYLPTTSNGSSFDIPAYSFILPLADFTSGKSVAACKVSRLLESMEHHTSPVNIFHDTCQSCDLPLLLQLKTDNF